MFGAARCQDATPFPQLAHKISNMADILWTWSHSSEIQPTRSPAFKPRLYPKQYRILQEVEVRKDPFLAAGGGSIPLWRGLRKQFRGLEGFKGCRRCPICRAADPLDLQSNPDIQLPLEL
eukprot:EG_transcript_41085